MLAVDAAPPDASDAAAPDAADAAVAVTASPAFAAASPAQRKRVKRSDFPDMDDVQYSDMMKLRRKAQETQRERGRDRKGRSYPAREQEQEQKQKNIQEYRAGLQKIESVLFPAAQPPSQSPASPRPHRRPSAFAGWKAWKSAWSEEVPQLAW